jgi:hypothetical protein
MGAPRIWAATLLQFLLRHAPADRRDWAEAMLAELDHVDGDWSALVWALGCTSVIFRELAVESAAYLWKQVTTLIGIRTTQEENKMNETGKKTLGVLAGILMALALGVGLFFLRNVIADALLSVGIARTMWSHILSVILPAELIVVVAAILLWRKRQAPIAAGLLLTGFVMAAHVAVMLAMH